jgi:integrase/recombinase XerD
MVNGGKVRTVYMNDKVVTAIQEYLKERNSDSPYLFISRQANKVSRSRINQLFNKYSDVLTPHGR